MFRTRVTPSRQLDDILYILSRRGVQVYVSPEAMDGADRYDRRRGRTAVHTSEPPLIWVNLWRHGYAAGGVPEEAALMDTLLREVVHAMTALLGHTIPDASTSIREEDLKVITIRHGASLLLDRLGLYIQAGKNRAGVRFCSRRVNDEAASAAAKTLAEEAVNHFVETPGGRAEAQ
jgi:hypothetical protein